MIEIIELAKEMVVKQSFDFMSFSNAKDSIERACTTGTLNIVYDRLSLCIYKHNLTDEQYGELGIALDEWNLGHNNDDQKKRIEYGILFHYALLNHEIYEAVVIKELHPDFRIIIDGTNIGMEITRLEKEDDILMYKIISKSTKPGLTAVEIMAAAIKKHGQKAEKFEVKEIEKDFFAIFKKEVGPINSRMFSEKICEKIRKYTSQISEFDEFVLLCNAVHGITITSDSNAKRMIDRVRDQYPNLKMKIVILYNSPEKQLQCYVSLPK